MIKVIASVWTEPFLGMTIRSHRKLRLPLNVPVMRESVLWMATGRNFRGAMDALKDTDITCDYILSSGAEVRNPQREVVKRTPDPH